MTSWLLTPIRFGITVINPNMFETSKWRPCTTIILHVIKASIKEFLNHSSHIHHMIFLRIALMHQLLHMPKLHGSPLHSFMQRIEAENHNNSIIIFLILLKSRCTRFLDSHSSAMVRERGRGRQGGRGYGCPAHTSWHNEHEILFDLDIHVYIQCRVSSMKIEEQRHIGNGHWVVCNLIVCHL